MIRQYGNKHSFQKKNCISLFQYQDYRKSRMRKPDKSTFRHRMYQNSEIANYRTVYFTFVWQVTIFTKLIGWLYLLSFTYQFNCGYNNIIIILKKILNKWYETTTLTFLYINSIITYFPLK